MMFRSLLVLLCALLVGAQFEPDFKIVSFLPEGGVLRNRQAITVVFNIPVLPLGADLAKESLDAAHTPFTVESLNGNGTVAGTVYWVTTSIARFDPDFDWPTDLKVAVRLNRSLRSASGQKLLEEGLPEDREFLTPTQTLRVISVSSKMAEEATDGKWTSALPTAPSSSSFSRVPSRRASPTVHEVPPDGKVKVRFDFPVSTASLSTTGSDPFVEAVPVRVGEGEEEEEDGPLLLPDGAVPCEDDPIIPVPFFVRLPSPAPSPPFGERTKAEGHLCAEFSFPQSSLQSGKRYELRLKNGAMYHPAAGPSGEGEGGEDNEEGMNMNQPLLTGLRPFQLIPRNAVEGPNGNITASEPVSTEWKRQRVFVNHGLPKGDAALEAFKERLRLSPRVGGGLDVEQVDVCTLQLSGDLKPGETYTLSVRGSEEIKDGLGMPLQDSSIRFTVNPVDAEVASPSVRLLSFPLAAVQRELSSLAAMQTETEVAEFDWPAIVKRALGGGTEETPEPASEGSTTGASRLRGDLLNLPLQRGEAEPTPQPQTPARMPRRVERAEVGVSPMSVDEEGDALKNLNHIKSLFWNQQAAAEPDRTFDLLAETDGEGGNAKIANVTLSLGETSKFWRMDKDTEFCTTVQRTASQRVTPASTLPSRAVRGLQAEPEERCFDSAEQTMVSIPSVQISTVKFYTRREKAVEKEGEEGESLHTEMETAYRMAARVQSLEETGAGVEKATVALWSLERRSSTVSLASSAETDKDGVAVVDFLMDGPSTAHVLTVTLADGETYVSPTLDYSFGMRTTTDRYILGSVDTGAAPDVQGFSASDVRGVWSTDRAVYKPGEDLAVHGYAVASPKACAATAAAVGVERTEADGPCPLEALEANKKPLAVLMKFTWGRNSWRDQKCSLVKVPLDAAFGSFQTEVPVPPDADYGILQNPDFAIVSQEYELSEQLLEKPCTYLNSYGLMQFTSVKGPSNIVIADPRPPSVIINLDVPPFVPPQNGTASLPVSGSLMTFTGSPVMQLVDLTLEISLQTVEKKNGQEEEDEESGDAQEKTVDIPTGSEDVKATLLPQQKKLILSALDLYSASEDGSFAFTFQIPKGDGDGENQPYTFRATAGDALLVTAEAKGLAGEFVTETMTSAVDRSPLYISHLELLPSQPLPGRLFSVSATVKERPRAPASADATNAKVQVTMLEAQQPLYERQQTDATYQYFDYAYVLPSGRAPQSIPCSQVIAPFLLESGGVDIDSMVASGNFTLKGTCEDAASPECALRMDALKHHIVIAQVGDSEEAFSTGCAYVGKTLEEWEAAPLTSFSPTGLQAKLVEPEVHFGEVAKLSIENSFHGDADLTVFVGTGDYGKVLTFTVPPNQDAEKKRTVSEFELGPVPSDCLGGCPVYVFLSAPLSLDGSLLKSISPLPPMSPLLPDFGPQLLEKFLTLKAKRPDEGVEAVSVTLRPGTSEGEEDGTPNGGIGLSAGGRGEEGLPVFAPGQTVEAEVEVLVAPPLSSAEETTVPQEEEVDVEVEVTLLVVDSSLLELRPLEMMEAEDALVVFDPNMIVDNGYSSLEHFASPEGLHEAARILAQRANEDPHAKVSPLPSLASDRDSQRLHEGVEEFLKKHFGMITTGPGVSNGNSNFLPFMSRGGVFSETFAMRGAVADSAVPESYSAVPQMAFATASAPAAGGSAGGPGGAGLSVALRQDFARRVAFVTGTGTGRGTGTVSVSVKLPFELPDNEGEFTVRAFTTTRRSSATPSTSTSAESSSAAALTPATLHWSSTETALISRIPALLRPALPRFLRVGDSAEVGAALVLAPEVRTQAPNAAFRVELMELSGASLLEEDQKVQIVTPDSATERIFWKVRADRGLGTATVRFGLSLQMEDGLLVPLDAVEETIEVLPHQSKVVVGTSSSLSASALLEGTEGETSAVVQEALALPSAVPGFGGLNLTAASGFSAGILGLMDSVRGGAFKDYRGKPIEHPGGGSLLSYLFASSVISDAYGIPLSQEAQSAARKALKLLPEYTDSEGLFNLGFYSRPVKEVSERSGRFSWRPKLNLRLTSLALIVEDELAGGGLQTALAEGAEEGEEEVPSTEELDVLASTWKTQLDQRVRELREEWASQRDLGRARGRRSNETFADRLGVETLLWLRLAVGSSHEFGLPAADERSLSWAALKARDFSDSLSDELLFLFVAQRLEPSMRRLDRRQERAWEKALESVRVQGQTAYIAVGGGGDTPLRTDTQATALSAVAALSGSDVSNPLVSKVATFVAAGGASGPPSLYRSSRVPPPAPASMILSVASLRSLDESTGSDEPDMTLTARLVSGTEGEGEGSPSPAGVSGETSKDLTTFRFTEEERGPLVFSSAWEDLSLPSSPSTAEEEKDTEELGGMQRMSFEVSGTGSAQVAVQMEFIPADLLDAPTYKGLLVRKVVQRRDDTTGECVGEPLQEVESGTRVCVTIEVTTRDRLNAVTIEDLVSAGLEPEDPLLDNEGARPPGGGPITPMPRYLSFLPSCSRETKKDQVTFQCWALFPGAHSFKYVATVNAAGVFAFPGAKAFVQDQPEVFGMSAGSRLAVRRSTSSSGDSEEEPESVFESFQAEEPRRPIFQAAPKGCDAECPEERGGFCDLDEGVCMCPSEVSPLSAALQPC